MVAEIIVGAALGSLWNFCSSDWHSWDFEHAQGCRLEIKQSAARQTWSGARTASKPIFDIRARKGYFEGSDWIGVRDPRRFADMYVFAYHSIMDATADHRDPLQWRFYVVPANRLPIRKTISLIRVGLLADAVPWADLETAVENIRMTL